MDELASQEYKNLRATIRERGTVRPITFLIALVVWAAIGCGFLAYGHLLFTLLALMVLVAGFETVFHLHVGVERVGRYLQVAYEERAGRVAWETIAMAFGQGHVAVTSDPLFTRIFLAAALVNLIPVLALRADRPVEMVLLIVAHTAFALRVLVAKRQAGRQRAEDLARFRQLLS